MIKGMTGFGSAQFSCGDAKGLVEVCCWAGRGHAWSVVAQILGVLICSPPLWGAFVASVRWQIQRRNTAVDD